MEWNGMEWNRMESNGMEWNRMEWNGMEWNRMEWNGMEWNGIESVSEPNGMCNVITTTSIYITMNREIVNGEP